MKEKYTVYEIDKIHGLKKVPITTIEIDVNNSPTFQFNDKIYSIKINYLEKNILGVEEIIMNKIDEIIYKSVCTCPYCYEAYDEVDCVLKQEVEEMNCETCGSRFQYGYLFYREKNKWETTMIKKHDPIKV